MNKEQLIEFVADRNGTSKADAGRAVNAVIEGFTHALVSGDRMALIGFGIFSVKQRAERKATNLKNGQIITIPARKRPTFKASKILISQVNKG